jgi:hypothetical protein
MLHANDPEEPAAIIGRCEHCDGKMYMGLPASVADVVRVTKTFMGMHKGCCLVPAMLPLL